MEILVAIAGKLAEYTVEPVGRQVGYLAHYKSNHQNLQTKLEDLGAARVEVEHKVDQVKRSGQRIETSVQNWMTRVDAIITEANTFLKDGRHAQTECLHGFCPNLALCYQLSKKSTKLVEEIVQLHGKKEFPNFAYDVLPQEVVFSNLTAFSVHSCGRLRFLFSFSLVKSLVELKHLKVSTCEIMEEIVSTRDQSNAETIDNMFHKLKSLTLDKLPNLARFCGQCKKLDVKGETVVKNCLFDSQVKFLSLEKLKINELSKLQTIWNNQLADQDSFHRLGEVNVCKCKSLQKIFTASVARGLQELYMLTLEDCDEVDEIIVGEEGLETTPPLFVFPKVISVKFRNMPKLSRFYPGMHASKWPLLKNLDVIKCDNVKMFAAELPIFGEKYALDSVIEQSLFLIDKDSFPNLEWLHLGVAEIWYGPSPAPFFSKLKSICRLHKCAPFSKQALLFFEKLQNLDTLKVWGNDSEEYLHKLKK